ncbi:MAG: hypothetical protein P8173_13675 [Gammaproteobacteria bacterium]
MIDGESVASGLIEMVYGVIEVKTKLNIGRLTSAFKNCAEIRSMAKSGPNDRNKAYLRQANNEAGKIALFQEWWSGLAPRYFVFSYGDTWKKDTAFRSAFLELTRDHEEAHIHGVCSLGENGGRYIHHKAFKRGDERVSKLVESSGFRTFLTNLDSPGAVVYLIHIQIFISTIAPRANGPCVGERSLAPIVAGRCMPSAEVLTPFCYLT